MKLLFKSPKFDGTVQMTCRRGDKWAAKLHAHSELPVRLPVHDTGTDEFLGYADVVGVIVCPFKDLPDGLLLHEHEPSCRSKPGLLREMRRVYDEDFQPYETVTVMLFAFSR